MTESSLYFSDVKTLFKSKQRLLLRSMLFVFCSAFLFFLCQSLYFETSASFTISPRKLESDVGKLNSLLQGFQRTEGSPVAIMKSKRVLQEVVSVLGLQASIQEKSFLPRIFHNIWENLIWICRGKILKREHFLLKSVHYNEEKPCLFYLQFLSKNSFQVFDRKKQLLCRGELGKEIELKNIRFTVEKTPRSLSLARFYQLRVSPWIHSVTKLSKKITIKPNREDPKVVLLTCKNENRFLSAQILNEIMLQYKQYLIKDHENIANLEIAYLDQKQKELGRGFKETLQAHTQYLQETLGENGFAGLSQEIELLSIPKERYHSKLFDLDLELKRWETQEISKSLHKIPFSKQQRNLHQLLTSTELLQPQFAIQQNDSNSSSLIGLDLTAVDQLNREYLQKKNQIHFRMNEFTTILQQMQRPEFEVRSLSQRLNDSVSQDIIRKTAQLLLDLQDENHRTPKEQERIKISLENQKASLRKHLLRMRELDREEIQMLEEKLLQLQTIATKLIQNEKKIIHEKLDEIKHQMSDLPEKWQLENELKFKKDLAINMIKEITKFMESKVISLRLFQVESKPLDSAVVPFVPLNASFSFSILSALFFGAILFFFYLFKAIRAGMPISEEWLEKNQRAFAGNILNLNESSLERLSREDLETMRKALNFLSIPQSKVVAVIGKKSGKSGDLLAELLALRGSKVLIVELQFNQPSSEDKPGLWHYLQGMTKEYPIKTKANYDVVSFGHLTAYGTEVLHHLSFSHFLTSMEEKYDVVFLKYQGNLNHSESQALMHHVDKSILILNGETIKEIMHYIEWENIKGQSAITYVIHV